MELLHTPELKQIERQRYFRRLIELKLADEVREGMNLNISNYEIPSTNEQFLYGLALERFIAYLNLPTIIDSFVNHYDERVPAYNQSGIFDEFTGKASEAMYMGNRLRLNKVLGVIGILEQFQKSRSIPIKSKDFLKSVGVSELVAQFTNYSDWSNSERLKYTEHLVTVLLQVINEIFLTKSN